MRATRILQRQFDSELQSVHLARRRVVFAAVDALLRTSKVSLTSLGRAIAEHTSQKHGIKRVDRLLGNPHLHRERLVFYRAIACRVISVASRPVIIVDWTAVTPEFWALVAAVCFEGRALIVYAETHSISDYLKPDVNAAFLQRLASVLPPHCIPIIVADAGFRSPFMKLVAEMGWDYIVRVRGLAKIRQKHGQPGRTRGGGVSRDRRKLGGWLQLWHLYEKARPFATDCGTFEISRWTRHTCRVVMIQNRVHHRRYHCRSRLGSSVRKERRAAQEPWILATSLVDEPARVVAIYTKRMQIEETFRDTKSPRFGLSLTYAHPRSESRANALLLLASIAHLLLLLIGLAAEAQRMHLRYQANTVKDRRVLSLVMLGRLLASSYDPALLERAFSPGAWLSFGARAQQALSC